MEPCNIRGQHVVGGFYLRPINQQVVNNRPNAQLARPMGQPAVARGEDMQTRFIREAIESHNRYRARHGCPPLVHNQQLSNIARQYAQNLASRRGGLVHSGNRYSGQKLGENLAWRYDSTQDYYSGQMASKAWYDEVRNHNFQQGYQPATGHFTQLIWKSSTDVGFGIAKASDGSFYVVANYYPCGNVIGRFDSNVSRPLR